MSRRRARRVTQSDYLYQGRQLAADMRVLDVAATRNRMLQVANAEIIMGKLEDDLRREFPDALIER